MTMQTSAAGIDFVKAHEGFREQVYDDQAGDATIGYGHKLKPGETFPDGVTEDAATLLLRADLAVAEAAVNGGVSAPLSQSQFDALADFTFNLGGAAFQHSTLRSMLNARAYAQAAESLLLWCYIHVNGVPVRDPGLYKRRQDERALFLTPDGATDAA